MKRKFLAIVGVVALLAGMLVVVSPAAADGPPPEFPRNSMAPAGPDPMDATVEMLGKDEIAIRKRAAQVGSARATNASPAGLPAAIGDELTINISDFGLNLDYNETFVVLMDGTNGIILLEKAAYDNFDPGTGEYVFPNLNHCWRPEDRISTTQLTYLLNQFDTVMYPTNTALFGEPVARGDEGTKTWILIFNIRDESYYDCSQTSYVAGYFSAGESATNNKNMMHIDTYDWANRTGPTASRPYLYEGVFAHEFEHLLHFDRDPDEESWVDEGMADLAGFLCGYGHSRSHLMYYMVYHPMTSLTFWGGGLEDYGASYLFALYLYEKFGGAPFISALVQEQANSIEGVENTLSAFGYRETFDEIFDNWTIANYLDDTRKAGGKYGYENLEIGSIDTGGYTIEYAVTNFWWGSPDRAPFAVSSDWLSGLEPQPYTAHYWRFNNNKATDVFIDGADFAGTMAHSPAYEWYSGMANWAWRSFHHTFTIPAAGATLNFWTFYEIEGDWDYAYVEVHDLTDDTWTTLPGLGTTNTLPHAQDNPNTPAGFEPADYCQPDPVTPAACLSNRWNAFTGNSGGWYQETMDLSPFAGDDIELYFRSWQDGASTLQMMYVDDISIPEIGFSDDVESGADGWTSTGWYVTNGILENGFGVTTIDTKWVPAARYPAPAGNNAMELHSVRTMTVDPITQSGVDRVPSTPANSGRVQVAIVSNHAGHILTSHYEFGVR